MTLLRYTGHPFVDVGVATITAFSGVRSPEEVAYADLEAMAQTILELYIKRGIANYLGTVVFGNARFANPYLNSQSKFDEQRRVALAGLTTLFRKQAAIPENEELADSDENCAFCGKPAIIRASRMLIPMISDEASINFVPEGRPRLPICGLCVLAILAMPLGALKSQGKVWLVTSPDPDVMLHFARSYLRKNQQAFHMQGLKKVPDYTFAKTQLLHELLTLEQKRGKYLSITAYLLTSNAQNAHVQIFHLPSTTIDFIFTAKSSFPNAWDAIVARAWETPAPSKGGEGVIVYQERNFFFEDLFDLPDRAFHFLRLYLLRQPRLGKAVGRQKLDPRFGYSFIKERECIHWSLTELFLERIMNIDKERIASIKQLADRLADYIQGYDPRLFKRLLWARNDYTIRLELQKAANAAQRYSDAPLVPYDEFIRVFFFDEGDAMRPDWYLARDLLMIRIIERLHQSGWIEQHPDITEVDEPETESEA